MTLSAHWNHRIPKLLQTKALTEMKIGSQHTLQEVKVQKKNRNIECFVWRSGLPKIIHLYCMNIYLIIKKKKLDKVVGSKSWVLAFMNRTQVFNNILNLYWERWIDHIAHAPQWNKCYYNKTLFNNKMRREKIISGKVRMVNKQDSTQMRSGKKQRQVEISAGDLECCFLSRGALIRSWLMLMARPWFMSAPRPLSRFEPLEQFTWREAPQSCRELPLTATNEQPTVVKREVISQLIAVTPFIRHCSFLFTLDWRFITVVVLDQLPNWKTC